MHFWSAFLPQARKYEKNPKRKEILDHRINGYMTRAESLSKWLKEQEEQDQKAASSPSPVADAAGGAAKDKDEETNKLCVGILDHEHYVIPVVEGSVTTTSFCDALSSSRCNT